MPSRPETAGRLACARDRLLRQGAGHLRGVRRDDFGAPLPRRPAAGGSARDAGVGPRLPLRREAGLALPTGPRSRRVANAAQAAERLLSKGRSWRPAVPSSRPHSSGAALVLICLAAIPAFAQTFSFLARQDYPAGVDPRPSALGDFDGDGRLDLVTANVTGGSLSVFLGNGDGTFRPFSTIPAGTNPYSIAVADLDGDGTLDLAVAQVSTGGILLFPGHGDGTFDAPHMVATSGFPFSLALGDMNRDGIEDLIVANYTGPAHGSGKIQILLGNGGGPFRSAGAGGIGGNEILVLVGNGDGTFQSPQTVVTGRTPYLAAIGDLDGNGMPDLAVADSRDDTVSILMNNLPPPGSIWSTPVNAVPGLTSLRKYGACAGCYDAGATTTARVASGDASAEFEFLDPSALRIVGLAPAFTLGDSTSIDFCVRVQAGIAEDRRLRGYRPDDPAAAE